MKDVAGGVMCRFLAAAHMIQDNFQQIQAQPPFQAGNRIEMGQQVQLGCQVEGNPRYAWIANYGILRLL